MPLLNLGGSLDAPRFNPAFMPPAPELNPQPSHGHINMFSGVMHPLPMTTSRNQPSALNFLPSAAYSSAAAAAALNIHGRFSDVQRRFSQPVNPSTRVAGKMRKVLVGVGIRTWSFATLSLDTHQFCFRYDSTVSKLSHAFASPLLGNASAELVAPDSGHHHVKFTGWIEFQSGFAGQFGHPLFTDSRTGHGGRRKPVGR